VALGKRASDFTRRLCQGKHCRIEYDPANAARAHRDRYKRLLAYVWAIDDGGAEVFVNAEIIRQGYGKALTAFDYDEARKPSSGRPARPDAACGMSGGRSGGRRGAASRPPSAGAGL